MVSNPYPTARGKTSSASSNAVRRIASSPWRQGDLVLVLTSVLISLMGVLMIYSATRNELAAAGADPHAYLKKQLIFTVIGFAVMVAVAAFDYRHYRRWAGIIYGGMILTLLAVFTPLGHKSLGAQGWFKFGSFQLEPAEFAVAIMIVVLAAMVASKKEQIPLGALVGIIGATAIPFLLIYKESYLGGGLVILVILLGMLVAGGTRGRHLAALGLLALVCMIGVTQLGVLKQYQKDRLTTFLYAPQTSAGGSNPYSMTIEYNLEQSKTTIAHGGVSGRGLFKGTQTNLAYVPNQSTDFIFTAVGEQLGFLGSASLVLLFLVVIWRSWKAASSSRDLFGALICVGALAMFAFQVFENVGMTMGIMPVAGIPLPFMSYGGSALVADWIVIGLVLNVRMHRFS